MVEKINQIARAADVSAQRANGLGERPHLNVHAPVNVEVVSSAAPVAAEHAGRVRVINHHDGAVFLGQITQRRQRANVAVHGKHAVGDQQLVARLDGNFLQQFLGVDRVFVAKDLDLGAGETRAVDDAVVVQLVGDDEVCLAQDG